MKHSIIIAALIGTISSVASAGQTNQVLSADDRMAEMDAQLALIRKESEVQEALRNSAANSVRGMPQVVSVSIVGGKRSAVLSLPGGRQDRFFEGDEIIGNLTLQSVTLRKVTGMTKQGKKSVLVPLEFGTAAIGNNQGGQINDPNRTQPPLPASMLPLPPVVQIPSISSLKGANVPASPLPAQAKAAAPATPPAMAITTPRN